MSFFPIISKISSQILLSASEENTKGNPIHWEVINSDLINTNLR